MEGNMQRQDDKFARESFSFRRMTPTQLWGISIVAAVVVLLALIYGVSL